MQLRFETELSAGLGPAGSGKTTAKQAYAHVAAQAGRRVVPLATSAAAAILDADLNQPAENLHKFLWEYMGGTYVAQLHRGENIPVSLSLKGLVRRTPAADR
ncbi:hypothetical protein P3T27_005974 [Kitasatospora sp. MAA19]|uniref:AAA family ATPase n=1 Tax=unclassified Kitasatospora TaxID=2633591 RepID=UPI00247361C4|nr:AAA family ATPase [Kitasatospora sp. MAA19]MDH6709228.1 hypothetical protein [Kitasatospora sp. MAA19]